MKDNQNPKHFSYNFELKTDNLPARKSDRMAFRITYPGMFLGLALIVLGIFELVTRGQKSDSTFERISPAGEGLRAESFLSLDLFDAVIIALGLWIVASLFISYIKYKKIKFDGKKFEVTYRPFIGKKRTFSEPLKNYEGVHMRIEFFQFGFINRSKFIVELRHKDPQKTVPLYISTNGKNFYSMAKSYVKKLDVPVVFVTNEGLRFRQPEDIDRSLKDLVAKGIVKNLYNPDDPLPDEIAFTRKGDKTIIKVRKILWDAYNLIGWAGIILFGGVLAAGYRYREILLKKVSEGLMWNFYVLGIVGVLVSIFVLFRKDKIVIKEHKVIVVHKFMLFSRKKDEIKKDDIETITISLNPATGRYFLAIIGDDKTIVFGKKMPVSDLKWVKNFLINEIVR